MSTSSFSRVEDHRRLLSVVLPFRGIMFPILSLSLGSDYCFSSVCCSISGWFHIIRTALILRMSEMTSKLRC